MKRVVLFWIMLFCLFGTVGCTSNETAEDSSKTIIENPQNTENDSPDLKHTWTKQEISSLFIKNAKDSWRMIDCTPIPDYAYDKIGAVLYWDNESETSNVAFIDADGHNQCCGVYAKTNADAGFTYLGNGKVTFFLQSEEGTTYNCNVTLSIDGSNVHFTVEDDLTKQSSASI